MWMKAVMGRISCHIDTKFQMTKSKLQINTKLQARMTQTRLEFTVFELGGYLGFGAWVLGFNVSLPTNSLKTLGTLTEPSACW